MRPLTRSEVTGRGDDRQLGVDPIGDLNPPIDLRHDREQAYDQDERRDTKTSGQFDVGGQTVRVPVQVPRSPQLHLAASCKPGGCMHLRRQGKLACRPGRATREY